METTKTKSIAKTLLMADVLTITFNVRSATIRPDHAFGFHLRNFEGDKVRRVGHNLDTGISGVEKAMNLLTEGAQLQFMPSLPPGTVNISITKLSGGGYRVTHFPLHTLDSELFEYVSIEDLPGVVSPLLYNHEVKFQYWIAAEKR